METDAKQLTAAVYQDTFPGAYIEPKWSRIDQVKNAPYYAMRLALNALVTYSPKGSDQYVSLTFDGKEYVLHKENFKVVLELSELFRSSLQSKGYDHSVPLRFHPDIIIEGLKFLTEKSLQILEVPLEKARMIWLRPDLGPCGEYRCRKPFMYMQNLFFGSENSGLHLERFYTEHTEFTNFGAINWFDAFMIHRAPNEKMLTLYQSLYKEGKTLIFEYDDDIFNIPEWNHNIERITPQAQQRARQAIEISDLVVCSTEQLKEVSGFPEKSLVGPNLIDITEIGKPLKCNRIIQEQFIGYKPERVGNSFRFIHSNKVPINEITREEFEPIRILWTGSNTHDNDVEQIIRPIVEIGKEYGIAVCFIFFGYCPPVFLEAELGAGNTKPKFGIKSAYQHFIQFIDLVKYSEYLKVLRSIDPDFALCPLCEDDFNLSKSNLKVLELGALGIPCIVSDFGPYKEFRDHDNCLKVSMTEPDWKCAIEKLIHNNKIREDIAFNIREKVISEFSWNVDSPNRRKWDTIFDRIYNLVMQKREAFQDKVAARFKL